MKDVLENNKNNQQNNEINQNNRNILPQNINKNKNEV